MTENRTIQENQLQCNVLALYMLGNFAQFYVVCRFDFFFFKIDAFKNVFRKNHQSVKQFESRSGSGSNYFEKVISRRQMSRLTSPVIPFGLNSRVLLQSATGA